VALWRLVFRHSPYGRQDRPSAVFGPVHQNVTPELRRQLSYIVLIRCLCSVCTWPMMIESMRRRLVQAVLFCSLISSRISPVTTTISTVPIIGLYRTSSSAIRPIFHLLHIETSLACCYVVCSFPFFPFLAISSHFLPITPVKSIMPL